MSVEKRGPRCATTLLGGAPCVCERTHVVTVSADAGSVESRLLAGEISCPCCVVGCSAGRGSPVPGRSSALPDDCSHGGPGAGAVG